MASPKTLALQQERTSLRASGIVSIEYAGAGVSRRDERSLNSKKNRKLRKNEMEKEAAKERRDKQITQTKRLKGLV